MLSDIVRFNRESVAWLEQHRKTRQPARLPRRRGYSRPFAEWYLLPMAAAIWSCPAGQMLDYPLASFVRFCRNHGLLQVFDRPLVANGQWRRARIRAQACRLARRCPPGNAGARHRCSGSAAAWAAVRTDAGCRALRPGGSRLPQRSGAGDPRRLGDAPPSAACSGAIRYAPNRAVLHTDAALLPRSPALWSAWNYLSSSQELDQRPVSVSYLINRLQPLPFDTPLLVSLNPQRAAGARAGDRRVRLRASDLRPARRSPRSATCRRSPARSGVWFCGAWNGYGFHEDGLKSALQVANALGCRAPWQGVDAAARTHCRRLRGSRNWRHERARRASSSGR
jgi:predicted NAD/FAD-binding protein